MTLPLAHALHQLVEIAAFVPAFAIVLFAIGRELAGRRRLRRTHQEAT
jgi:hypothetical protein